VPDDRLQYHAEIFANRVKKRHKHLSKWARRNDVTCFRLYDRDIPEVPLVVDLYENNLHVAEFESPHKNLPGEPDEYRTVMLEAARRSVGAERANVFYKQRRITGRTEQYERTSTAGEVRIVNEGGLRFEINLSDYLDTGLFLDHRVTRSMVRDLVSELAAGGPVRVLNLFSYTGSFTVYAADGGAFQSVNVDLSRTYTDWAGRNMQLNHLSNDRHLFLAQDALRFLEHPDSRRFDVVILDPPTFSNSKKMDRDLDLQRDHVDLIRSAGRFLRRGGFLLFSTNRKKFNLETPRLDSFTITDITEQTVPPDFRDRRVHRCWLLENRGS